MSVRRKSVSEGWGVFWTSRNRLDGLTQYLVGGARFAKPDHLAGYRTMVFKTRAAAREHIKREDGYIASRPDLKREPHGWTVPKAVRVTVTVKVKT